MEDKKINSFLKKKPEIENSTNLRPIKSMTFMRSGTDIPINADKQKSLCVVGECAETIKCRTALNQARLTYSEVLSSKFSSLERPIFNMRPLYTSPGFKVSDTSSSFTRTSLTVHKDECTKSDEDETPRCCPTDGPEILFEEADDLFEPKLPRPSLWNWQQPVCPNVPFLPFADLNEKDLVASPPLPFQPVPQIVPNEMPSIRELSALQPARCSLTKNCSLCKETRYLHDKIIKARQIRSIQEKCIVNKDNTLIPKITLPLIVGTPDVSPFHDLVVTDLEKRFLSLDPQTKDVLLPELKEWNIPPGIERDIRKIISEHLDKIYIPQPSSEIIFPPDETNLTIFALKYPENQIINHVWSNSGLFELSNVEFNKNPHKFAP